MKRAIRLIVAAVATTMSLLLSAGSASAHEPGMSAVLLAIGDDQVVADLQLPLDRLELAVDLPLTDQPDQVVPTYGEMLTGYITDHVEATGSDGAAWSVDVGDLAIESIDGVDHLVTTIILTPPGGVVTDFALGYDVILERLLSHEIVVSAGPVGGERVVVGTLSHVTRTIAIDASEQVASFGSMVSLGLEHVLDGADHLLFLVVLLVPAPLLAVSDRRWGPADRLRSSSLGVIKVATAFTLGHSLTLVASASGWISVPSRPVEVVVALSIAVGAVHALRPIVPHGEAFIAGGFGLVHGLAFAGILDNYGLGAATTATSLLGFNIGVELAQLVTIALVFPSLYVMSQGRLYRGFRVVVAGAALAVSIAWVADRLGLWPNPFGRAEGWVVTHPLVIVGALGAIASLSTIHHAVGSRRMSTHGSLDRPVVAADGMGVPR